MMIAFNSDLYYLGVWNLGWFAMWQLSARRLLPMSTEQPQTLAQWPIWQLPGRQRNTPLCPLLSVFNVHVWTNCSGEFRRAEFVNVGLPCCTGRRICSQTGEVRESSYLLQRISVSIQRFNSVLCTILWLLTYRTYSHPAFCFSLLFLIPTGDLYYLGY